MSLGSKMVQFQLIKAEGCRVAFSLLTFYAIIHHSALAGLFVNQIYISNVLYAVKLQSSTFIFEHNICKMANKPNPFIIVATA